MLNYLWNFFSNTESSDGKIHNSRLSWRYWTRQVRKIFSRRRRQYAINEYPRIVLPKLNLEHEYQMNHEKRGLAIIFNHKYFDQNTGFGTRWGTEVDLERLEGSCEDLGFITIPHNDLTRIEIFEELEKGNKEICCNYGEINFITFFSVSKKDHSNHDCILIAILSHGESEKIFSRDDFYNISQVTSYFTDEACPSLAGKPKLFFIQSCRGDRFDFGHPMFYSYNYQENRRYLNGGYDGVDVNAFAVVPQKLPIREMCHNPPNHPDFLIVRSTMTDYVSFRNTTNGSWFIQHLCEELDKSGTEVDILTLLTHINEIISRKESSNGRYKQILCISTMLTKKLTFYKKNFG